MKRDVAMGGDSKCKSLTPHPYVIVMHLQNYAVLKILMGDSMGF